MDVYLGGADKRYQVECLLTVIDSDGAIEVSKEDDLRVGVESPGEGHCEGNLLAYSGPAEAGEAEKGLGGEGGDRYLVSIFTKPWNGREWGVM